MGVPDISNGMLRGERLCYAIERRGAYYTVTRCNDFVYCNTDYCCLRFLYRTVG